MKEFSLSKQTWRALGGKSPSWPTGQDLEMDYGIKVSQLFNKYVKKGLQPHNESGERIPPPDVRQKEQQLKGHQRSLGSLQSRLTDLEKRPDNADDPEDARRKRPQAVEGSDRSLGQFKEGPAKTVRESKKEVREQIKDVKQKIKPLKESLSENRVSWRDYVLPGSEPEKQAVFTSLTKAFFKEEEFLKLHEPVVEHDSVDTPDSQQAKALLPCKQGTKWEDITITLLSNDMVRVKTPKGEGRFTYHELGLQDKRGGDKPTKLWLLLKLFAKRTGVIHSENSEYDPKLPDTAKRLNRRLKKIFGINESIYQAHYKKEKAYRTKISFEDNTFSNPTSRFPA